ANDGINELVTTYNKLVLERMKMASNAKADNVALRKISEQLDALRSNIILTMSKVAESAQVAVDELRTQLTKAQNDLVKFPRQELQFRDIRRNSALLQSLYTFLTQKREETAILLANTMPKGRIVDEAYTLSEPVSMSKKMILAICLLFGMFVPFIGIYLMSIFRTKLVSREEIEGATDVPVLGEICTSRAGKSLVVTPGSKSSTVELFKLVRTNLDFVLAGTAQKVVIVTSSNSGEGKSFISINTAAAIALTGKKVVLVGMDIRKPRLAEYLDLPAGKAGVTAYLADDAVTVDEITMRTPLPVSNLDVITAGVVPPNPSELLLSSRLEQLFAELRARYDYIIVDSAPLGLVSDTFSLGRVADATVFVTRVKVTTKANMRMIAQIAEEKRLPRVGVVVNGTDSYYRYGYGEEDFGKKHKGIFSIFKRK
ncbi:MAG: polysaccharide biosynthesis tyrosine autokinase, partial [Muribaculaceae bacterium]|nr:polysaccharide biosynthesis tyrosine autokinase [Muribaculaceae bacterium]